MNSLKVLIFCCLIYQSIAGGPSFQSSSSSSIPASTSTRPSCWSCKIVVTLLINYDQITKDCDPGSGTRTLIKLIFADDERPDLTGYCTNTNEYIDPNDLATELANYKIIE